MRLAWHGNATVSVELAGIRMVIDPFLSRVGTYGAWHVPNPGGLGPDRFIAEFAPHLVIITHGHWDHFDLEAVRQIEAALRPRYVATPEAVAVLTGPIIGAAAERCHPLEPGGRTELPGGLALSAFAGDHWFTGAAGDAAAAKLTRHYGVMPCGGAMLQLVLQAAGRSVYISGDTLLGPVPELPGTDLAVVSLCHPVPHPVTRELTRASVGPGDLAALVQRLRPRHLVPVHWDFPLMDPPITAAGLREAAAGLPVQLHLPPYHLWVDLEQEMGTADQS